MLEFILKYWTEVAFTALLGIATWFFKDWKKLAKLQHEREEEDRLKRAKGDILEKGNEMLQRSEEADREIRGEISEIKSQVDLMKNGILMIQGKMFRDHCKDLLKESHTITTEEWEEISNEHTVYNSLGGNHRGDELFQFVKAKAQKRFTKMEMEEEEK